MLDKNELYDRLHHLYLVVADDIDHIKNSIGIGIPSLGDMWEKVYVDILRSALLMKIEDFNAKYCQNNSFDGDCRLVLLSCYMCIMSGIREAAFRYGT